MHDRELIAAGSAGDLLMLHCAHRNASVPDSYIQPMLINDSVVHEFDVVPWLAGGSIVNVEVRAGKRNSLTPDRLREPILVLMELDNGVIVDVEMNVSIQFGYQVATEAVGQWDAMMNANARVALVLSAARRSERDTLIVRCYNITRGPVEAVPPKQNVSPME